MSANLFWLFIKEEYRAQSSMFKSSFLMYPAFILMLSGLMGLMLLPMRMSLSTYDLVTLAQICVFMSGMLVGGMAMFQEAILERRMPGVRLLLNIPGTLPVSNKKMFAFFYFKDILYYICMNVLPVLFGLYLSTFITGLHVDLPLAAVTFILSFLLGVSVSFALSTIAVRSKALFAVILLAIVGLAYATTIGQASALTGIGRFVPTVGAYLSGSLPDIAASIIIFIVLSAFSLAFIRETPHPAEKRYKSNFSGISGRFRLFGRYSTLAAKEWIDLMRSGGLGSVLFSFVLPLLFLWGLLWMMSNVMTFVTDGNAVSLPFNTLFYSIIIGFFATLVYGWLNNLDNNANYRMLPVTMPDVIKAKLILFVVLNTVVSVIYLGLISLSRGELALLPAGLFTMFMVSGYTGVLTAYMTGIFTNSLMFDYKVMSIYALAVAPVLVILILLSFYPGMLLAVIGLSALLGVAAWLLLGRIDKKWGKAEFGA
ncbi:hypothetical protein [Methanocella arvoryzae]|uniref:ABC-type transport system, permease component n=1 Tax=Methanocella arvoryzae (strain DSM 22066 / NBRC 105507 / MRE50) TaxID=351160 RepID=Q0W1U3_METAR|nr:hypothetical protein [Methanocella arvoryzae]CAJ37650.1 conserved hypothetical protein [Methanocella arvoryzae MRE50]